MGRKQEKRSKYGADSVRIDLISHHVKTSKHKKTSDTIKKEAKKVLNDMMMTEDSIKKSKKGKKKDIFANITNENNEWKDLNPNFILPVPGDSLIVKRRGEMGEEEEIKAIVIGIKGNLATYKIRCPSNSLYNNMPLKEVLEFCNWKFRFNKIAEAATKPKEKSNIDDDVMMEN